VRQQPRAPRLDLVARRQVQVRLQGRGQRLVHPQRRAPLARRGQQAHQRRRRILVARIAHQHRSQALLGLL